MSEPRPGRLAWRCRGVRAQAAGAVEAFLQGIGDGDAQARVHGLEDQEMEEPHAARAQDGRAARGGAGEGGLGQAGVAEAAQHAGGGLQEDRGLVAEMGRQAEDRLADGPLAHQHPFGEAARPEQVLAEGGAERLAAAPAERADTAGHVVRHDHPIIQRKLTLEEYLAMSHVLISPRGGSGSFVDTALAEQGLRRRIAVQVPHFLVAPFIVAQSNLCLTAPDRLARIIAEQTPLRVLPPPLEIPGFTTFQIWHERHHHDAGHAWLRGLLAEISKSL